MMHENPIKRRPSRRIYVGNVPIGDNAPIAVQSMTNTETTDVQATVEQIKRNAAAGADIWGFTSDFVRRKFLCPAKYHC